MKKVIVTVQDLKSGYADPFIIDNEQLAVRMFRASFMDNNKNIMSIYPEDFRLVKVGEFDSKTGVIEPLPETKFVILANGTDFKFDERSFADGNEIS